MRLSLQSQLTVTLGLAMVATLLQSCSTSYTSSGELGKSKSVLPKRTATLAQEAQPSQEQQGQGGEGPTLPGPITFVDAEYEVTVSVTGAVQLPIPVPFSIPGLGSNFSAPAPCTSRLRLRVNVSLDKKNEVKMLELPEAFFTCGQLGSVNLQALFGPLADSIASSGKTLSVKDNVVFVDSLGDAKFSPNRPIFPSFIVAKQSEIAGVNLNIDNLQVTTSKGTYSGSVGLKVNAVNQEEPAPGVPGMQLSRVMDFTLSSKGFGDVDRVKTLLIEAVTVKMNTMPVAITVLGIKTKVGSLLHTEALKKDGVADGWIAQAIDFVNNFPAAAEPVKGWGVDIQLKLLRQEGLAELLAKDQAQSQLINGERIGPTSSSR